MQGAIQELSEDGPHQKNLPRTGPLPVCQGCKQKIKRGEPRIRNNHKAEKHHEFDTVHQFHIKSQCLMNQNKEQLDKFLKKMVNKATASDSKPHQTDGC